MTLLVFFSAPARTRLVAAHFGLIVPDGLDRRVVAADARRLLRLPPAERRVRRGRAECRRRLGASSAGQDERRSGTSDRPRHRRLGTFAEDRPQPPQVADDLFVHPLVHRLEQREAFFLVLDERIALAVPAQADAFLQVIEAVEVILPLRVDDLQHDVALDALQDLAADELLLLAV